MLERKLKNSYSINTNKTMISMKRMLLILFLLALNLPVSAAQNINSSDYNVKLYSNAAELIRFYESKDSIQIKAVVVKEDFETMLGATLLIKNTTYGTSSDFDGEFVLDIPSEILDENTILECSNIGYFTQEINLKEFLESKTEFIQMSINPDYDFDKENLMFSRYVVKKPTASIEENKTNSSELKELTKKDRKKKLKRRKNKNE